MQILDVNSQKGKFFKVFPAGPNSQAATMTLKSGEDSGPEEIHQGDQIIYVVSGNVEVKINDEIFKLTEGMAITVPAGTQHHLYNRSASDAFIFTTYSAPEYPLAEEQV